MAIEIRAAELASLDETAHLLGSPRNAEGVAPGRPPSWKAGVARRFAAEDRAWQGPLKYILAGAWSRRITQEHRLIYKVSETRVDFLQARYHY
jgi:hypothetical protein